MDLKGAYTQFELEQSSKKFTTVNTSLGLLQYNRLVFGIKTAPAIFQSVIDQILNEIKGVVVYYDDILLGANSHEECMDLLRRVLSRLKDYNVTVNFEKCKFFVEELT